MNQIENAGPDADDAAASLGELHARVDELQQRVSAHLDRLRAPSEAVDDAAVEPGDAA